MPRKRPVEKDSLAQKLNFDKLANPNSTEERRKETNLTCEADFLSSYVLSQGADFPPIASPERPLNAALIPTDFSHRDRLRFNSPKVALSGDSDGESGQDGSPKRLLILCVCIVLFLIVRWLYNTEGCNELLQALADPGNRTEVFASYLALSYTGFAGSLLLSFCLGVSCLIFSCGMTYQDSLRPGLFPPSPVSPQKFRRESGHTFHSSYAVAFINGIAMFALSVWWLSQ